MAASNLSGRNVRIRILCAGNIERIRVENAAPLDDCRERV